MSKPKRKIDYVNIFFDGENKYFKKDLLKKLLTYMLGLEGNERIYKNDDANKAIDLESMKIYEKDNIEFIQITFKSCKYNHSPNYMSSFDGSERKTDKKLSEGDKEMTHMLMRLEEDEAYTIYEKRRSGATIKNIIDFMNCNLLKMIKDSKNELLRMGIIQQNEKIGCLAYGIIPAEDCETLFRRMKKFSVAELFIDRKMAGSEYFDLMDVDTNIREDLTVIIKAERRKSIGKNHLEGMMQRVIAKKSNVKRFRIYGKDDDNLNIILDSLHLRKMEEIVVDLHSDGTVNSDTIFKKMEELLK